MAEVVERRDPRHAEVTASILLLSTADWAAPLWTNKQYMACELAAEYDVTYVESMGLRKPQLTARDARRLLSRLRPGLAKSSHVLPRPQPAHLNVVSPKAIPYHSRAANYVNKRLVHHLAGDWLGHPPSDRLLWTYTPVTYGLEDHAPVIYHCVDLLGAYPGISAEVIRQGEARLASKGAVAVASSPEVALHLQRSGFRRVIEWPNVAEVDRFIDSTTQARSANMVVFGGNISPYKIDCSFVAAVKERCPGADVVMAGPIAEGGGREWPELRALREMGVRFTGHLPIEELSALFNRASVGIIPYLSNAYTNGVLPLKVNEYLAAGLPVVSSPLPSLRPIDGDIVIAQSRGSFADEVERMLGAVDEIASARRRERARNNSWAMRGIEARAFVAALLSGDDDNG
jgi:teichuronic acid biosynthesis glycosyltransferase TuaH